MKRIVIIPVVLLSLFNFLNFTEAKSNFGKIIHPPKAKSKLPQKGKASFYSIKYSGKKTANADFYNPELLTAAHESLPMGQKVKVTNLKNNKFAIVLINDRCACSKHGRIIDVSKSAAKQLDFVQDGTTKVLIEAL
jgi:rare lipoprotein A